MSLAPAGYTVAITRIPLHDTAGIYRLTGRKAESTYIIGTPVLNVVDGRLSSVTVYRGKDSKGKRQRPVRIPRDRVSHLGLSYFTSAADRLTFAAVTR